jgi:hypothetical protein
MATECYRVSMPERTLDDLVAHFTACTLPATEWTHTAHLRVGLWHVERYGAAGALHRLRDGIRRLNESYGNQNTATSGYHETITVAYVRLIAAFLDAADEGGADARAEALLAGPIADRNVLLMFWSKDRLMSPAARAAWTPPDLAPLRLPALLELTSDVVG